MMNIKKMKFRFLILELKDIFHMQDWNIEWFFVDLRDGTRMRVYRNWEYNDAKIEISAEDFMNEDLIVLARSVIHEFCHAVNSGIERLAEGDPVQLSERYIVEKTCKHWETVMWDLLKPRVQQIISRSNKNEN